jgi:hypothetical protein
LAPDTDALQFDDTVKLAGFAKRRRRDIANGNAGRSLTIENAVVGVPEKHCVNAEPINRLFRSAGTKEGKHFGIFPFNVPRIEE